MRVVYRFPASSELTEAPPDVRMGAEYIPREGDLVVTPMERPPGDTIPLNVGWPTLPYYGRSFLVSSVTWFPWGDPVNGQDEPVVLVVLVWNR